MNLVLLETAEAAPPGPVTVTLTGRRARHLIDVIGVQPGRRVRVGIVDGPLGEATVSRVAADAVTLHCAFTAPPPQPADLLILAMPRPAVFARCLELAAALGFATVAVIRAWRTDKAHLDSSVTRADRIDHHLRLGLEQAVRTARPRVRIARRFRPFVEDELPALAAATGRRVVGHLDDAVDVATLPATSGPIALAVGPERGFTAYEVDRLAEQGFVAAMAGPHPLRVETALTALHARLDLLRALAGRQD